MRNELTRSHRLLVAFVLGGAASVASSGCAGTPPQGLPSVISPIEPAPPPATDLPPPAPEPPPPPAQQPDPQPLLSADQYELDLVYERGAVTLRSVARRQFPQPVATPRRIGRFAIELWVGEELVERVRFDFPLLASSQESDGTSAVGLDAGLVTSQKVLVPASDRARRAVLVDRTNGKEQALPWPPITPAATAPAGARDDDSLPQSPGAAPPEPAVNVPAAQATPAPAATPTQTPAQPKAAPPATAPSR